MQVTTTPGGHGVITGNTETIGQVTIETDHRIAQVTRPEGGAENQYVRWVTTHPFTAGDTVRIGTGTTEWTVQDASAQRVTVVRKTRTPRGGVAWTYRAYEYAGISRLVAA
jgi:hypothetical protein